jgi:hypothetical protein
MGVAVVLVLGGLVRPDACGAQLGKRAVEVGDEEADLRDVAPISRGPETAKREPSGRSNMSADAPATSTRGNPSTSRTNAAISGRRSVAVPAKTRPRISKLDRA